MMAPYHGSGPGGADPARVWWAETSDGVRLRCALWQADDPRGHVILLPGRTEYLEKVAIVAAEFLARGLSVAALDWRGQGLSDRVIPDRPLMGHVGAFGDYRHDLQALLDAVADDTGDDAHNTTLTGPQIWFGHSMGGAIAIEALTAGARAPAALVLSAPMIRIAMPAIGRALARATIAVAKAGGRMDRWPPLGDMATPYPLQHIKRNALTSDETVWAWLGDALRAHPDLGLGMPSIRWFAEAERIAKHLAQATTPCPTLVVTGGDDTVVDRNATSALAQRAGWQEATIAGARHEPFLEAPNLRAQAWAAVDEFLATLVQPA